MNATTHKNTIATSVILVAYTLTTFDSTTMTKCRSRFSGCNQIKRFLIGLIVLLTVACLGGEYLCIDVSEGEAAQTFPVSRMDKVPDDGWRDEYKTNKIVLKKINDGDKTFYIGVFEITQRQWELVTGKRPSYYKNENCYAKRPVEKVAYDDIRGKVRGAEYPKSSAVDETSFIGILRSKSKLNGLDLPTRKQWELACREPNGIGITDSAVIAKSGRFSVNPGYYLEPIAAVPDCDSANGTAEVGSYAPNGRGLYDMYGNVTEWCLDACYLKDENLVMLSCHSDESAPWGIIRVLKGGNCEVGHCGVHDNYKHYRNGRCCDPNCTKRLELIGRYCSSSIVYGESASLNHNICGLRIVVTGED